MEKNDLANQQNPTCGNLAVSARLFNKENYHLNTSANWRQQARLPIVRFGMERFISESESEYIFEKTGVWRISNHWGKVGSCQWNLVDSSDDSILNFNSGRYNYIGFCRWDEFKEVEPDEDAY